MKISTLKSLAHSYLKASNAVSMIEEVQGEVQELWVNSSPEYGDDTQIEELQDQLDEAYSHACALEESLDQAGRDACANKYINKGKTMTRKTSHSTWEQIKNYGTAKF